MTDAKVAVKLTRDAIQTAHKIPDLFNDIDTVVPWKHINTKLTEFNEYHEYYSQKAAASLGKIKTHLMNGIDEYFEAARRISEWCSLAVPLLTAHIKLFENHSSSKAKTQNRLLYKVLTDGIVKMTKARIDVEQMVNNFNVANQTFSILLKQFESDFDEKSEPFLSFLTDSLPMKSDADLKKQLTTITTFYRDLSNKINEATLNVNEIVAPLKKLIHDFEQPKAQSEKLTEFEAADLEVCNAIVKAVKRVIAKCNEYDKKHDAMMMA